MKRRRINAVLALVLTCLLLLPVIAGAKEKEKTTDRGTKIEQKQVRKKEATTQPQGKAAKKALPEPGKKAVDSKKENEIVPGNNGTIKVDGQPFDSMKDNEPHVGCTFRINFWDYDKGNYYANVRFQVWPPTGERQTILTDRVFIGEDEADGSLDASAVYDLREKLKDYVPHPEQGSHIKLTVNAEGSQGSDVKHKVFWVKCSQPTTPPPSGPPTVTPPPPSQPPTVTPPSKSPTETPTKQETVRKKKRPVPFLPFTGGELGLILSAAAAFAGTGGTIWFLTRKP